MKSLAVLLGRHAGPHVEVWLQVVRRLWTAALSFDSATAEQLLERHEVEPDTRHPDSMSAVVHAARSAAHAGDDPHSAQPTDTTFSAACAAIADDLWSGEALVADTVPVASLLESPVAGLTETLQVLLRHGWTLTKAQGDAAVDLLEALEHEDCVELVRLMRYLGTIDVSARKSLYGNRVDFDVLREDMHRLDRA